MKNIWTEKELEIGMFIIKNNAGRPIKQESVDFARTVVFKIGFNIGKTKQKYGKISVLTDGAFIEMCETMAELVEKLNSDNIGYRPLEKEELKFLIDNTQQGFY